jgi:HlyD family secretion protein
MISDANFEVESFIPEADIAQIHIGDTGTTTLDAYGDSVSFVVVVTAIDLSETEVDGVSTYKTTLQFTETDDRILSGMTANIDLVSETRSGVLSIPQSAVTSKAGKRTVMVRNTAGKTETRDVRTGSRDNAGNIEVLEGVAEGETIIWLSSK